MVLIEIKDIHYKILNECPAQEHRKEIQSMTAHTVTTITQNKTKKVILAALFAALAYVSIQSLHVAIFAPIGAPFFHVGNAQALAIRLVGTFVLVGGGRTAPQELFWHLHKLENLLAGIEYLQGGFCAIFFKLIGTVLIFLFLFARSKTEQCFIPHFLCADSTK